MRGPKTFQVNVDNVGTFECRRRVMRTAINIEVEYARLTQGVTGLDVETQYFCRILAYLKAMVISGPDGWDIDDMDPDDAGESQRLQEVFAAIKAEDERFRGGAKPDPAPESEGA